MTFRPLVVIPTKDNVGTIAEVARGCLAHCPDVVVVNDGSTDGTAEAAREVEGVRLLHHAVNRGKGAALTTALVWAREHGFSHIIAIDADGQHLPEELPRFLAAAEADPWAIHVGVRDMEGAPGSSMFGRNFSNFWVWVETGHRLGDTQSGYRVYPVEPVLSLRLPRGRYEWEVQVLVLALWKGIAVRDLPCRVIYPTPEERVSSFRPFWDNVRISLMNTRLVVGRILWPPRWFNPVPGPGETWKGKTYKGWVGGWEGLLKLMRLLGRRRAYAMMVVVAAFYWVVAPAARKGMQVWLQRITPGLRGLALRRQTFRTFHMFACQIVDRFSVLLDGPEDLTWIRDVPESVPAALDAGGAILLSGHVGNPDLAAAALRGGMRGAKRVSIVQYAAGGDPYVALLRRHAPPERVPTIITLNNDKGMASLEVVRALREGQLVAIKGDRVVDSRNAEVRLLGARARVATGPLLLAAISHAPVVMMSCFKEGPDTYRILASEPKILRFTGRKQREEDLARWAQDYADQLSAWAQRYPDQWFNFFEVG
ncbi:MAG: glycosyltransferase family 2 protein [Alphaproteobacteria bacterium]|nr:glycosyltransferase family 2 protein [Alphaproteobacteria bacterium]